MEELLKRIAAILKVLEEERHTDKISVQEFKKKQVGYNERKVMLENPGEWDIFQGGSHWGGKDVHCCFKADITIPEDFKDKVVGVGLRTGATDIWDTDNPQFMVYLDGEMKCAMDINHQEILLSEAAVPGQIYELGLYAYSNSEQSSMVLDVSVYIIRKEVEQLYYDLKVPFEVASLQRSDSLDRIHTIEVLARTINYIDLRKTGSESFYESIRAARRFLLENFYKKLCGQKEVTVHSIGHTHIDVAWKWPLRQTREKVLRSFKTVLYLMERYPEYKFMSSQPQLYEFVKQDCPEVYEQIKGRIKEGRWETEGAMWLEADCNLTSGESLIRQILYGKQFFKKEFGKGDNLILWLPDVFGYSAALPQIMKKSGIRYFMTTKIAWNEYNQIPNDVMLWKGIDGTEILTYFITTKDYVTYPELVKKPGISTTYNGRQNASQVMGTWQRFQNKELLQEVLTCYGYGDGGGGPTAGMLEESKRLEKGIPGCPSVKQTFVKDYFELIEKKLEGKKIPKWCGELYLEFHRGTYTSMARNKRYNRLCEFKNADAEFFSIAAGLLGRKNPYPTEELERAWKLTLLNQFHDILPGSSIGEVYEDSDKQYAEVFTLTDRLIKESIDSIAANGAVPVQAEKGEMVFMAWNQLSFTRDSVVEIPRDEIFRNEIWGKEISGDEISGKEIEKTDFTDAIEILDGEDQVPLQKTAEGNFLCLLGGLPPKGYRSFKVMPKAGGTVLKESQAGKQEGRIKVKDKKIDTPFYSIELNEWGEFISLYDRDAERELVKEGEAANRLMVFEDRPAEYDAWNIDVTYTEKSWVVSDIKFLKVTESGPVRTVIHVQRNFLDSIIDQDIIFYPNSKRIDFKTKVDWRESQLLLKVSFPLEIITEKATYDIQYGNVERATHKNTSWEQAKFEVCVHKWADLAEDNYGVALMNDCKYGYDIQESVMRLTLIKSGIFPNPTADQEIHHFTYSLLPHKGDFREGKVIQKAYDLNCPVYGKLLTGDKLLAENLSWSMLWTDQENVFIDVIKKAESSEDIIIRLYEAYGRQSKVKVTSPILEKRIVFECDLMEKRLENGAFKVLESDFSFLIRPYEIKTFRIKESL